MDVPFQKFVIKGKAFTQIFFKHLCGPDTELHAVLGFDAIAHLPSPAADAHQP